MITLIFDTETSGMVDWKARSSDPKQPHIIQLGAILSIGPEESDIIGMLNTLINPSLLDLEWTMEQGAADAHGISRETILEKGVCPRQALRIFYTMCQLADEVVAHNIAFDSKMVKILCSRLGTNFFLEHKKQVCSMKSSTDVCKITNTKGRGGGQWKWPNLTELHTHLFKTGFENAHDAMGDVLATRRCFYELRKNNQI